MFRVRVDGLDRLIADCERVGRNPRVVMRTADTEVQGLVERGTVAVATSRQMSRSVRSNEYSSGVDGVRVVIGAAAASSSSDLSWAAGAQAGSTLRQFPRPTGTTYTVDKAVRRDGDVIAEPWVDALARAIDP